MEPFKPNYSICLRACCVVLACCFAPLYGGENPALSSSNKAQSRSDLSIEEARELLTKGDSAYENARYADAVEAYVGAREMIPD